MNTVQIWISLSKMTTSSYTTNAKIKDHENNIDSMLALFKHSTCPAGSAAKIQRVIEKGITTYIPHEKKNARRIILETLNNNKLTYGVVFNEGANL